MAADNLQERNSRRKMLRAIEKSLERFKSPYLSSADLRHLGIQQLSMPISSEKGPLFFRPYNAPVQPPEIDTLTDYYPEFDNSPFRNAENLLNQYFQSCTLPKKGSESPWLIIFSESSNFGSWWQVQAAWNIANATVPHLKTLMYSGIIGNEDELFRGELLAIIDVMCRRLNTKSLHPHIIAPNTNIFSPGLVIFCGRNASYPGGGGMFQWQGARGACHWTLRLEATGPQTNPKDSEGVSKRSPLARELFSWRTDAKLMAFGFVMSQEATNHAEHMWVLSTEFPSKDNDSHPLRGVTSNSLSAVQIPLKA